MGFQRHHAILATTWSDTHIEAAHDKAVELFGFEMVSNIVRGTSNKQWAFFVGPDGSYEGWPESDAADQARELFYAWLSETGSFVSWCEVIIRDDNRQSTVTVSTDAEAEVVRSGDYSTTAEGIRERQG